MEVSTVTSPTREPVAARPEPEPRSGRRAAEGDLRISLRSKLRAELEIEHSKDGIEVEFEARFRSKLDARLGPGDREAADDGLARIRSSVSARVEIEIAAEDTPAGLAEALGRLAEQFSGAVDSLREGLADAAGVSLGGLLGGLRDVFGGLLEGVRDAFAVAAGDAFGAAAPAAEGREPPAPVPDEARPAEAVRPTPPSPGPPPDGRTAAPQPLSGGPDAGRSDPSAPREQAPAAGPGRQPGHPLHHRETALRQDLELRFVAGLRALLARLSGGPAPTGRVDPDPRADGPPSPAGLTRIEFRTDLRARFVDLHG